ncbi:MAG: hypothetical protein ACK5Z5_03205 [Neisseriaceae bacterium]
MNSLQGTTNSSVPQLNQSNKHNKLSDTSKESYFFQDVKSDEGSDEITVNNNLLVYPDIHSHILSLLDQKDLLNKRLVNRATKEFINKNINRNFSIQLRNLMI